MFWMKECQFQVQSLLFVVLANSMCKKKVITVLQQHAGSGSHSCSSSSHSLLLSLSQTSQLIDAGLGIIILLR